MISDFSDKPFEEFLKAKDIDGNLLNYIVNAIGILKPNATTEVVIDFSSYN